VSFLPGIAEDQELRKKRLRIAISC